VQVVGNDVVDLDDPDNARSHQNERFVARVCTPSERAMLAAADDPTTLLWTLFAAKEAAYKIAAKLGPAPGFAHRRFEVAEDLAHVTDRATELRMWLHVEADPARRFVHAVATTGRQPALHDVREVGADTDQGRLARSALCEAVAGVVGCGVEALEVRRAAAPGSWDGFGPPVLERDARPVTGVDVTLSHDGRFVAFAASIEVRDVHPSGAWNRQGRQDAKTDPSSWRLGDLGG